jgi:anti-sigma regulatory factor (Ser/Thr protein kinase)
VTLVRSVLAGLGKHLELAPELLDDLKTAISEACNNVVVHAYDDEIGPMVVTLEITADGFEVVVCDYGSGIQRVAAAEERMGVGLAVISALADRAEFDRNPDGGTVVRMLFSRGGLRPRNPPRDASALVAAPPELNGDIVATLAPVSLLSEVLGRIARTVAAGAYFSVDRFSDLYPVTDAVAAHASEHVSGQAVSFAVLGRPRHIELTVGPLRTGSGAALVDGHAPAKRAAVKRLVDALDVHDGAGYELLTATIEDRRPVKS